jgi:hypothetical protein
MDECGNKARPSGLVACTQAFSRISMEILVEQEMLVPAGISLKPTLVSETGAIALWIW